MITQTKTVINPRLFVGDVISPRDIAHLTTHLCTLQEALDEGYIDLEDVEDWGDDHEVTHILVCDIDDETVTHPLTHPRRAEPLIDDWMDESDLSWPDPTPEISDAA